MLASIIGRITIPGEELAALNRPATAPVPEAAPAPEPVRVAEVPAPQPKAAPERPKPVKAEPKPKKPVVKPEPKAKKAPKKPDPAKAEPSRVWVQVAGGANEEMLARAWKRVVAKAPAAMKGKSGWTTPLRATNRVLAGPFKSGTEAQAFVNALSKADVSAFVFTSEAGQKITRLTIK